MIGALQLHLGPLYYLVVPVVVAVVLIVLVALRHRRPKSLEANVESFSRGLQALSPGGHPGKRRGRRTPLPAVTPPRPPARTVGPTAPAPRRPAVVTSTPPTRRSAAGSSTSEVASTSEVEGG